MSAYPDSRTAVKLRQIIFRAIGPS